MLYYLYSQWEPQDYKPVFSNFDCHNELRFSSSLSQGNM